jgi:AcrR family transcriptional regulator
VRTCLPAAKNERRQATTWFRPSPKSLRTTRHGVDGVLADTLGNMVRDMGANMSSVRSGISEPTGTASAPKRLPADRRREQLLDVALKLFATRGFSATTMDEIAEAAGVTKPLLYQHFDSKRALYIELLDAVADRLLEEIGKAAAQADGPRQQVEGGFAAYFRLVATHADAFNLLFGSDLPNDPELSRAVRDVENTIAEAIEVLIDADLDDDHRRFLAHAVVGMAEGASRHVIAARSVGAKVSRPDAVEDANKLASRLADLAWAGLRSVHRD